MASAQVLPNSAASSKKQGHLEAGKRRLEEFRKKKAEGRTKKAASTGQLLSDDVNHREKIPQENEKDEFLVSVGAPSEEDGVTDPETSGSFTNHDSKPNNSVHIGEQDPINVRDADVSIEQSTGNPQSKLYEGSGFQGPEYSYYNLWKGEKNGESSKFSGNEGDPTYGVTTELAPDPIHRYSKFVENSHQFDFSSLRKSHLEENESSSKVDLVKDSGISISSFTGSLPGRLSSSPLQSKEGSFWPNQGTSTSYGNSAHLTSNSTDFAFRVEPHIGDNAGYRSAWSSEMQEKDIRNTVDQNTMESSPWRSSGIFSSNSEVDFRSSSNQTLPVMPETGLRRSHPSFLDSLNVSRESSASRFTFSDSGKVETSYPFRNSKVNATESVTPSGSLHPFTELGTLEPFVKSVSPDYVNTAKLSANTSASVKDDNLLMMHDFAAPKKDENFAALEQHIEDLTQEKFSLQRSLESSRALAESLAAENSSVSDSFNQQGMIVNQLKSDMERLQEEITDHLAQLEALKMEYCNAQLECSAADERAKILASEVIGLEEKVLRLRSNELKLERQLENSTNEINSYKRKVSSLEKEHHNLQSTVNALQEEKKMLQFKLRKASANGKVSETEKAPITKDISTSTEDLGEVYFVEDAGVTVSVSSTDNELGPSVVSSSNTSSLPSLPESREHSLDASTEIPHDQLRMITNINFLVSELVLEKEDLLRALALESSNTSKLKDLNKELSQKLEAQTQRLELLTAQRMASETIQVKTPDASSNHDSTMYTDEGDEVVERVLNWVMKLFPGGPAKRRTSKLL